jgi:hypothetical protein
MRVMIGVIECKIGTACWRGSAGGEKGKESVLGGEEDQSMV